MEQVSEYEYRVSPGEKVSIEVTPVGTGPTVTASQSPGGIQQVGNPNRPTFEFKIGDKEVPGKYHFAKIDCMFLPGSANDAKFDIRLTGSNGGDYQAPTITKDSPRKDPNFTFIIRAVGPQGAGTPPNG